MLDPAQQRVIGVLIEKERTVPDAYPLTEAALLAGCNQKSNRDPAMDLDNTELHPALLALREDGWIARVEGNRATRYRHRLEERLNVDADEIAVLCELLCRGPQAPGALKPRVARLGLHAEPARIEAILEGLAARQPKPLVERLARRPRERDHRWGHLLGPRPVSDDPEAPAERGAPAERPPVRSDRSVIAGPSVSAAGAALAPAGSMPVADAWNAPAAGGDAAGLRDEVAELRSEVDSLRGRIAELETALRDIRGY